ncbi:MAG TPA: hypothetical protein VFM55_15045 [Micromonosporaceae bacterium]|nr:hypothetical protein [Micromonosporaceae bacterium]
MRFVVAVQLVERWVGIPLTWEVPDGEAAVTVNDLLDGQVALDLECPDRVYLNGYVPNLQAICDRFGPDAVCAFAERWWGPVAAAADRGGPNQRVRSRPRHHKSGLNMWTVALRGLVSHVSQSSTRSNSGSQPGPGRHPPAEPCLPSPAPG